MTQVKIEFIEDGKIICYSYDNVRIVHQNGDLTVITFRRDDETLNATFYTKQIISLKVE